MPPEPSHAYEILDVFTDRPLEGNPLAVFTAGEQIPSRLMQSVARELNLSETAFLLPGDAGCDASVRIFTPLTELPFAGHPTLGAALVVGARSGCSGTIRLRTQAGVVPVHLTFEQGEPLFGVMEQPIPSLKPFAAPVEALLAALRTEAVPLLPVEAYSNGPVHVMVAFESASAVAALRPDMTALCALGEYGFSCFAPTAEPAHFKTRMFGPALGVAEDPATGSAAGPLALHLARHGLTRFGDWIDVRQGEEIGRPSRLRARVEGGPDRVEKVLVGGAAVLAARGQFRLQ
jgi:trans-2,3-dihydro-3-hydroxyanthranilate isomerase